MNRTITTTLMVMAGAATCAYAQAPAPAEEVQQAAATAQAMTPEQALQLQQDPQLVVGKLHNGLTYMIRPTKEPAGRASVRLFVQTGSLDENEETSGISHFLEHMVFNGSRSFKRGELIPAMQRLGLGFGGDANAYTSLQHTVYMLDLPNQNPETVNFAFTIMRDFADGATLEDEALDHERGIIVSELKSRDSESYRAMISTIDQLTEGTRISKYMPIGSEDVIKNAPYELFREYYKKHYVPERMTLIVTGDFEVATAEKWIRNHFVSMPKAENPEHPSLGTLTNTGRTVRVLPVKEQATVSISSATVTPYTAEPDTLVKRIKDMPLQLACAMVNRRLSRIAQQADSPFNSASVGSEVFFNTAEAFSLSVTAAPEKWQPALNRAEQELRKAIQYGFEEHEFTEVLSGIAADLTHSIETWDSTTADKMASYLINAVGDKLVHTSPQEDLRIFQMAVQLIAQNPDCCRAALEQAYNAAASKLTATGSIPADMTAETLEAAFDAANQVAVEKPELRAAKPFAYDNIGEPGKIVKKDHIADLDITTLTLSNGIKVNLKRTDYRKGALTVSAAVDGGNLKMPLIPGLNMVAGSVVGLSALEAHDLDELKRIMLGHNVDLNFGMGDTRMSYSGGTTEEDLELQCKLIVAGIMHPAFRQEAIAMIHRRLPGMYQQLQTTPEGAYSLHSAKALYGSDIRFTVPAREQVEAITAEQVKAAVEPFFQKGAMEVTLVGDFDIEKALPIIERTFGAMPARNPEFTQLTPEQSTVNFQPWGQEEFFRYPTNLDKTLVVQVRPAGNGKDVKHTRRLRVLTSIARAKLFDGIRAKMGETYSPSVSISAAPDMDNAATIITASAGVKRNRKLVNDAMMEILDAVGRGEITEDDFQCAIRPIIASSEKSLRQNSFWCGALADLQSDPEKIEQIRNLVDDFKSITLEEIQQLAKDIFGNRNVNCYYTVPEDYTPADEEQPAPAAEETPIAKVAPTVEDYTVVTTETTAQDPEWAAVADALVAKYPGAQKVVIPALTEESLTEALRSTGARYAGIVVKPEEVGRDTINHMHRAARKVDDDVWGDCIWGIVTGYSAEDAMRIAKEDKPLVIKRMLGTTNVGWHHFDYSYCITDWTNSPILEQTGGVEPTTTTYDESTEKGKDLLENGFQSLFAERLGNGAPQMVVTSSHATQFNLEMPFSRGLIFPYGNRFYQLPAGEMYDFGRPLSNALRGNTEQLAQLAEKKKDSAINPDGQTRVWIAAGNCLFGDAHNSPHSMAVTALSAYTCNQVVGYTVPS
ncbi:MAG: insulinase family protein, partial [Akkermansia sp.]|nr:insulinase family protein [Akkermansia sp.]